MSIRGERMLQADTNIIDDIFSNEYQRYGTVLVRLQEFQQVIILYFETATLPAARNFKGSQQDSVLFFG